MLVNDTCSDCPERAVCEYDWGLGLRRGCAAHDPLRPAFGATARVPSYYRTIAFPPAMTSTVGINPYPTVGVNPYPTTTGGIHPSTVTAGV